jgi:SAM-dependent methyltransferase
MSVPIPVLVVSPDAVIRYCDGAVWVHTGGRQKTISSRDPELIQLLDHFSTPRDEHGALRDLPADRQQRRQALLLDLKRIGALLDASRPDAETGPTDALPDPVDTHLAPLVDTIHRLAGEMSALGPRTLKTVAAKGVSVETRITALLAGATALAGELGALREEYVADQLRRLGIEPNARGLRLHLGAGPHRLPGWINIDAYPAELAIDLRWGLPFAAGAASHVFMSHTFEHFYYPDEAESVLRDIRRVLAPSGRLRVIVPDIEKCIQAYAARDDRFFADRRRTWTWWPEQHTRLEAFLSYAGAGPRPSHFLESHKFGYDFETLESLLTRCGYSHVTRSEYMQSDDPQLRVDAASTVTGAKSGDAYYSLFVEATA